jgi:UDP:flavonoid glycosyltransferase YjiC (YdhE family)
VEAVGAGVVLHRRQATAELLRTQADHVLSNPKYKERSAAIGKALRAAGGTSRAADEILNFLSDGLVSQEADHVRI